MTDYRSLRGDMNIKLSLVLLGCPMTLEEQVIDSNSHGVNEKNLHQVAALQDFSYRRHVTKMLVSDFLKQCVFQELLEFLSW